LQKIPEFLCLILNWVIRDLTRGAELEEGRQGNEWQGFEVLPFDGFNVYSE
jgi:hypothetical protein